MAKKKDKDWVAGTTCIYNIGYHIVWSTKYRKNVILGEVETYLKDLFHELEELHDFEIREMEVMPDHCHLFVSSHPKNAPSNIVKILKGTTARKVFMRFPHLKKNLWGGHLWNPSYYIGTVGNMSKEVVLKYIQNQKTN
jgi:putative transposase